MVGSTDSPRIWLLIGDKLGDNQQVELIGERLAQRYGWRCETRRLHFKPAPPCAPPRRVGPNERAAVYVGVDL